jgi:hypothetical protein
MPRNLKLRSTHRPAKPSFLIALAALLLIPMAIPPAFAQDDSPFDDPAAAPAAAPPRPGESAPSVVTAREEERPEHPVIAALRESSPTTLDSLTRATRITLDMGRPDEFKRYAAAWLALPRTNAQMFALQRKYGPGMFFEMARLREYQPQGGQMADAVLGGAADFVLDPARLQDLIASLAGPDSVTRGAALRGLRDAGDEGRIALIHALGDEGRKADRAVLRDALLLLSRDSHEPLMAALNSPQASVRADAARVLGRLRSEPAILYLVGLAASQEATEDQQAAAEALGAFTSRIPSRRQTAEFLARRIRGYLAGDLPGQLDEADRILVWHWDDAANTVRADRLPREQAALLIADRLAKQLAALATDSPALLRLSLLVQLEADKITAGIDQPLPQGPGTAWEAVQRFDLDVLQATLQDAIALDRPNAIVAVIEVLGALGRPEMLTEYGGDESPLVIALGYPDRRVQFAALQAIVALDSPEPFPGSSRVVEMMQYLLTGDGQRRILVGHPQTHVAERIGAFYAGLGYQADAAVTGRSLTLLAHDESDYELILLSDTIDGPNVIETIQILRKNPRTARIPVGVMEHAPVGAPTGVVTFDRWLEALDIATDDLSDADRTRLQARYQSVWKVAGSGAERGARFAAEVGQPAVVVTPPNSATGVRLVHAEVMALAGDRVVPPEIRLEQASYVLSVITEWLARPAPPEYYSFLRLEPYIQSAMGNPLLSEQAAEALSLLGTPNSQLVLVELASLPAVPIEERQAAATAFEKAVKHRGLQLSPSQISQQYDRYNASADADEATQHVLGRLLDIIEAPSAAERAKRKIPPGVGPPATTTTTTTEP